jgi:hypothetical protein
LPSSAPQRGGRDRLTNRLALSLELSDKDDIAWCLGSLATMASRGSQPAQAAALYGAAEKLRERIGVSLPLPYQEHYQRLKAHAHTRLGDRAFEAAWAAGQAMPLEQAVSFAMLVEAAEASGPSG